MDEEDKINPTATIIYSSWSWVRAPQALISFSSVGRAVALNIVIDEEEPL